jgi:Helix-turn-helix domain
MGSLPRQKLPPLISPKSADGSRRRRPPVSMRREVLECFVEADAAAEFLHYSVRSIKQMAREGRIPAHPFGIGPRKRWYFLISELAQHLRTQVNFAHGEAGRDKTQRRVV